MVFEIPRVEFARYWCQIAVETEVEKFCIPGSFFYKFNTGNIANCIFIHSTEYCRQSFTVFSKIKENTTFV